MTTKFILSALATVMLFGAAGAVQAQDLSDRETTTRSVRVYGSDLRSADGLENTYARLKTAARTTCDSGMDRDLKARQSDQACARAALDTAVADLNQPALSQLHAEKTGHAASVYADRGDERVVASK